MLIEPTIKTITKQSLDSVSIRKMSLKQKVKKLIQMLKIHQVTIFHLQRFTLSSEVYAWILFRGFNFHRANILTCAKVGEAKTETSQFLD